MEVEVYAICLDQETGFANLGRSCLRKRTASGSEDTGAEHFLH